MAQAFNDGSFQTPPEVSTSDIVPMVWLSAILAAIAGLLFGMDIGVISGALPLIQAEFHISTVEEQWIVGSMMGGAAVGALVAGFISKTLGRKLALLIAAALFVVGTLLATLAPSVNVLIYARILLGLAVGVASFTAPLYLSEIAPERIRGTTISFYQLMVTIGILAAFISGLMFSYINSWRWMFGVLCIPSTILFLGVLIVPNSPRWLASRNRMDEAESILQSLRSTSAEVDHELAEIREAVANEQQRRPWQLLKKNGNFRRSVALGIVLQVVQQFTGMNVMMYYAPRIFELSGFHDSAAQLWSTVLVGVVNVLATFIAIGFVDRLGRKPMLYAGFFIMALGMAVVSGVLAIGPTTTFLQYSAMVALLVFIAGFAMSAGPLIWTLCSEIQPLAGRDFGISCSTVANWLANMVIGSFFLSMLGALGGVATFALLAVVNLLFIVFTVVWVPETKGVSLEHIERNLLSGKPLRHLGR